MYATLIEIKIKTTFGVVVFEYLCYKEEIQLQSCAVICLATRARYYWPCWEGIARVVHCRVSHARFRLEGFAVGAIVSIGVAVRASAGIPLIADEILNASRIGPRDGGAESCVFAIPVPHKSQEAGEAHTRHCQALDRCSRLFHRIFLELVEKACIDHCI